jgi:hypothetical protein
MAPWMLDFASQWSSIVSWQQDNIKTAECSAEVG